MNDEAMTMSAKSSMSPRRRRRRRRRGPVEQRRHQRPMTSERVMGEDTLTRWGSPKWRGTTSTEEGEREERSGAGGTQVGETRLLSPPNPRAGGHYIPPILPAQPSPIYASQKRYACSTASRRVRAGVITDERLSETGGRKCAKDTS